MTQCSVILDSISPAGVRLTTLAVQHPRFILPEVLTHRMFSRSYASSRAIPVAETLRRVQEEPFIPTYWGKNERGMQASEECDNTVKVLHHEPFHVQLDNGHIINGYDLELWDQSREQAWYDGKNYMVELASAFNEAGYHKQLVNRLLEPFSYVTGIITSTEWDNFFALRLHPDAQPEFQELARLMKEAMDGSTPQHLRAGEWHLPYISQEDKAAIDKFAWQTNRARNWSPMLTERAISAARCARTSFASNERGQTFTLDQDLVLYDRLMSEPKHASPAEHQACPIEDNWVKEARHWEEGVTHIDRQGNYWSGNLRGYIQNRQLL